MLSIKNIMTTDVITVNPATPIYEALDLLTKNKVSGLPVVDQNREVVGILTEKDVLKILIDQKVHIKTKVEDYMTSDVICFTEEDNAVEICKFFVKHNIRRVPIIRDGKLVGIVSRRDIVAVILEAKSKMSDFRYV